MLPKLSQIKNRLLINRLAQSLFKSPTHFFLSDLFSKQRILFELEYSKEKQQTKWTETKSTLRMILMLDDEKSTWLNKCLSRNSLKWSQRYKSKSHNHFSWTLRNSPSKKYPPSFRNPLSTNISFVTNRHRHHPSVVTATVQLNVM